MRDDTRIWMAARFAQGETVQTPFGKGVVREVRNNGRLLVDVHGRAIVVKEREISALDGGRVRPHVHGSASETTPDCSRPQRAAGRVPVEVDLHGLTVEEALARVDQALNEALLADLAELRLIHGRSGGRIRAALHRRLGEIPSVRSFRVDPRNAGVTIVRL